MFLEEIEEKRRSRLKIIEKHVKNGVVFADEFTAYIDCGVTIGAGTHIGPCVTLKGDTSIGKSCVIGQNTGHRGFKHRGRRRDKKLSHHTERCRKRHQGRPVCIYEAGQPCGQGLQDRRLRRGEKFHLRRRYQGVPSDIYR